MKKLTIGFAALAVCAAMAFGLAACSNSSGDGVAPMKDSIKFFGADSSVPTKVDTKTIRSR